jgi:hypothetical protein
MLNFFPMLNRYENILDMRVDRANLAGRSWAIPAICGLLVLHHDFKHGRFSNVTRLEWAKSSVDIHFQYGMVNATGSIIESLDTLITVHQSGAIGICMPGTDTQDNHRDILHFLAGETSREARRWSEDLAGWNEGALIDHVKSSNLALVCAVAACSCTHVSLTADKSLSNAGDIRKIVLLNKTISTELTPSGEHGVSVYQSGRNANEIFRHRYVEQDLRFGTGQEKSGYSKFIGSACNWALMVMLLPVAMLAYFGDKMLMAEMREAGDLVEYLPDASLESRVDSGMSALSS